MRVIIAGPRYIDPEKHIEYSVEEYLPLVREFLAKINYEITEVVSGKAKGFDTIGEEWAKENDIPIKEFPVTKEDWQTKGKRAGFIRNQVMGEYADAAIVFWNMKSNGSKNMFEIMRFLKKPCYVVKIPEGSSLETFIDAG